VESMYFWSYSQPICRQLSRDETLYVLQFFVDLNFIQHVSDPNKKIDEDLEFFQFTKKVYLKRSLNSDFIKEMKLNLIQFKFIFEFLQNPQKVQNFYERAFIRNGLGMKNKTLKLKTYKNVFIGAEACEWIKKEMNFGPYATVVFGEVFRHLKAFDQIHSEHPFKDDLIYYIKRDEEEFRKQISLIYDH
jgi:hypothetical protein